MVFFSELQGKKVVDKNNRVVGILKDLIMVSSEQYPEITAIVYKSEKGGRIKLAWQHVNKIDKQVMLNISKDAIPYIVPDASDILLGEFILDKQIIDTDGLKVMRVNDILLSKTDHKLIATTVDVGTRGLMRRLGLEKIFTLLSKDRGNKLIAWEYVQPLHSDMQTLRLKVSKSKLSEIHPADLADLMEDMSVSERTMVFNALDNETAAETLLEADPAIQKSVFKSLPKIRLAKILEVLAPDEAVNLISIMHRKIAQELLSMVQTEQAQKIKEIMSYEKDSAGSMMNTNVIALHGKITADEAIKQLRKMAPGAKHIFYVYVVDSENKLLGVLSMRDLILAQPSKEINEIMRTGITYVNVHAHKTDVSKVITKYDLLAIPVVDDQYKLVGVITVDDILDKIAPNEWKKKYSEAHVHRKRKIKQAKKEFIKAG